MPLNVQSEAQSKRELWERLFIRWLRNKDNYKKYSSYFPKPKRIYKKNGIFKRSYSTNSKRKVDKVDLTVILDDGRKKGYKKSGKSLVCYRFCRCF